MLQSWSQSRAERLLAGQVRRIKAQNLSCFQVREAYRLSLACELVLVNRRLDLDGQAGLNDSVATLGSFATEILAMMER